MDKTEFMRRISCMAAPVMKTDACPDYDLLSCYVLIYDKERPVVKFCPEYVKLTSNEYRARELQKYFEREEKFKAKYTRWLNEYLKCEPL